MTVCTCDARFSGYDDTEYCARGCPACTCQTKEKETTPLGAQKILELADKSTQVVQWYDHGSEDGTVRGPFMRWLKCFEVEDRYKNNVASVEDDTAFCVAAMNAAPLLAKEVIRLMEVVNAYDAAEKNPSFVHFQLMKKLEQQTEALKAADNLLQLVLTKRWFDTDEENAVHEWRARYGTKS